MKLLAMWLFFLLTPLLLLLLLLLPDSFYFNKTLDPRPLQTYFRKPGTWTLGK
jgi:hypothetical protein